MEKILRIVEKIIPKKLYKLGQPIYHFSLAVIGAFIYGFPASRMTIIGVTGTKGKTSTTNFIHTVLSEIGVKVGMVSTANIKIAEKDIGNKYHMSMPGRFILQSMLSKMRRAKCKFVVLEVTSEGIKQFRHLGLFLDIVVFTNLSPEHLTSHKGSFEKYRDTKLKIFKKSFFNNIKLAMINKDDENAPYFERETLGVEEILFSFEDTTNIIENKDGVSFDFKDFNFKLNILGKFNIYNALPAIYLGQKYGLDLATIKDGLLKLNSIPGRMEQITEGQDFKVIVDYAHEKISMNSLLNTAQNLKDNEENKIIVVLGGDGGGRDEQRLYDMGAVVGEKANVVIVTNSDPYFDNQLDLASKIANEAEKYGKVLDYDLFINIDREEAIKLAISKANTGDVVLLTTRGSLNTMSVHGKKVPSDDREISRRILNELLKN